MPTTAPSDPGVHPAAPAALRLDQLPERQWATVLDVLHRDHPDDRELVLRLTEIGFVPGEAVRIMACGMPGREPLAELVGRQVGVLLQQASEARFAEIVVVGVHRFRDAVREEEIQVAGPQDHGVLFQQFLEHLTLIELQPEDHASGCEDP